MKVDDEIALVDPAVSVRTRRVAVRRAGPSRTCAAALPRDSGDRRLNQRCRGALVDLKAPQKGPHLSHIDNRASSGETKAPVCGAFAEPSDGLEPSTPPYHGTFQATGRNARHRISLF
jgi:hypothetical protein